MSGRPKTQRNRPEPQDSGDNASTLGKVDESGEDMLQKDFERQRTAALSNHESDNADDNRLGIPASKPRAVPRRGGKGKKRKSDVLTDSDEANGSKKRRSGATSSTTKRTPKKSRAVGEENLPKEDAAMQEIFDSIPTVKAPTPPPSDGKKAFDFRSTAGHSQPAPLAGSKEIPEGAENCLSGLTFVFTGLLDSLSRDEGFDLVKRYGGKITTAPSSKTNYVVLGNDAGPKKLETIAKHNLKTINEDGLFALIRTMPAHGGSGLAAAKANEKREAEEKKTKKAVKEIAEEIAQEEERRAAKMASHQHTQLSGDPPAEDRLWTVKYAPTRLNQICGNKVPVDKLQKWLNNWHKSAKANFKKGGPDGSGLYRAVMIHGSPGIGKTTAAHVVSRLEGYDVVESNASDTRSKKLIENGLKGVLDTTSLLGYFASSSQDVEASKRKLVLIMDEVDGMSAGDRGGVGAMASVCRKTRVPIILICNERKLPKMKPFDHVTFDLPFRKPTTDQVRARIQTILFREGLQSVPQHVVNALIEGAGADIRRVINMVSTVKLDHSNLDFDESKQMTRAWEKNVILRPWDITQKILGGGMFANNSTASINEKAELYFNDHEFSHLMLQENYLKTNPILAHNHSGKEKDLKILELTDMAASSIGDGDLIDSMIHGPQQHWSLMPLHAIFSFVRPASFISGNTGGRVTFTSWLGNNSKGSKRSVYVWHNAISLICQSDKLSRCVKEIQAHMRLRASGNRHEIRQQYLPMLWTKLVKALEINGSQPESVDGIIDLMDSYFLTRDDWDAICELGLGPQAFDNVKLSSQTKSTFTRRYNAASHPLPFMKAGGGPPPPRRGREKPDLDEAFEESDEDEVLVDVAVEDDDEDLDLKKDKYVKAPKKKTAPKKATSKAQASMNGASASEEDRPEPKEKQKKGRPAGSKAKRKK